MECESSITGVLQSEDCAVSDLRPVNAKTYYESLPASKPSCGDIWTNIPSFGLLPTNFTAAISISPACDISNFKTETLTFLPIISVSQYFHTVGFLPILRREILERLKAADLHLEIAWPETGYYQPPVREIEREIARLNQLLSVPKKARGWDVHVKRAMAGLSVVGCVSTNTDINYDDLSSLLGQKWEDTKRQLITNSYRNDIHFFPSDEQDPDTPGVKKHSLALFRYPITVPTELLLAAQDMSGDQWKAFLEERQQQYTILRHFSPSMPVKCLSLKASFLSDLLSRFTTLYARIGSPDFTRASVDKIAREFANG